MPTQRTKTNLTVSVAFPPELAKALVENAGDDKGSMSDIIRSAVARYLKLPKSAAAMRGRGQPRKPKAEE